MICRVMMAIYVMALTGIVLPSFAQKNYYVVVGAFSTEEKEKEFTTKIPTLSTDTAYAIGTQENVVHLYVLRTDSEDLAVAKSIELQRTLENSRLVSPNGARYESIAISNYPEETNITIKKGEEIKAPSLNEAASSKTEDEGGNATGTSAVKPASRLFKFTIADEQGQPLAGNIHYVDFSHERDIASYTASSYTDLFTTTSGLDQAFVCGIFGYKQAEKYFDATTIASIEGAYRDETGAWVIPYELERLEKGDVSVMYNVSFHKDAVVMLPQSQTDLDELVRMMKENPNYEITVHGHCNGKNDRKIIGLENPKDLFSVTSTNQFFGSAKALTSLRAEAVKNYLINNGIDGKRVKIFAWGGRFMLVDEESTYSRLNDRIEIEIRKD